MGTVRLSHSSEKQSHGHPAVRMRDLSEKGASGKLGVFYGHLLCGDLLVHMNRCIFLFCTLFFTGAIQHKQKKA